MIEEDEATHNERTETNNNKYQKQYNFKEIPFYIILQNCRSP